MLNVTMPHRKSALSFCNVGPGMEPRLLAYPVFIWKAKMKCFHYVHCHRHEIQGDSQIGTSPSSNLGSGNQEEKGSVRPHTDTLTLKQYDPNFKLPSLSGVQPTFGYYPHAFCSRLEGCNPVWRCRNGRQSWKSWGWCPLLNKCYSTTTGIFPVPCLSVLQGLSVHL